MWKYETNNDLPLVSSYETGKAAANLDLKKRQKHLALVQLLNTWREEDDEQEQRDTWEHLKQALENDRFSGRKLFP